MRLFLLTSFLFSLLMPIQPTQAQKTQPWGDKRSPFGVVASLGNRVRSDEMPTMIRLLQESGVQWNREEISWDHVQFASGGDYRWGGDERGFFNYDRAIQLQQDAGINMLGLLAYNPAWFKGKYPSLEQWLPDWDAFVFNTVKRYGKERGAIKYWEIWNEPNLAMAGYDSGLYTTNHYVQVLKTAQSAAQRADPEAKIVLGAPCDVWSDLPKHFTDTPEYLLELAQLGAWQYFDVLAIHPYRPGPPELPAWRRTRFETLDQTLDDTDALMAEWGYKPIWYTEMGWSREFYGIRSDEEQAAWMQRFYLLTLTRPSIEKIFWYDFRDDVDHQGLYTTPQNDLNNNQHHFGWLRRTYPLRFDDPTIRKPAFYTFMFTRETLSDLSWQATLIDPYTSTGLGWQRWHNATRTMDVIWWIHAQQTPEAVEIDCACQQVTLRAYDGTIIETQATKEGRITLTPPQNGSPIWIEWRNPSPSPRSLPFAVPMLQ